MITKEQINQMDIDDTQIQADLDDYEDMTLMQLSKIIQKYKNKMNKIKTRCDKIDNANNFDYSVIYDDIKTYSKKYSMYEADYGVRAKYINTINNHLEPVIKHYEILKLKSFESNKQKNIDYLKQKIKCECGIEVAYVHLKRHKLSKIHIKELSTIDSV